MTRSCSAALKGAAIAAALGVSLSGCQIMAPGMSTIPGAGYSTLVDDDLNQRTGLVITPTPLPRRAAYTPFRCSYLASVRRIDEQATQSAPLIRLSRARDRMLVTITEGANVSTALIGQDGRLFDFNLTGFLGGQRVDTQSYYQRARGEVARAQAVTEGTVHVMNEFSIVFPHYTNAAPGPGDVTTNIVNEEGNLWGRYVYRGTAQYGTARVAVLDLVTDSQPNGTPVVIGYNLIDLANMAPVLTVLDIGSKLHFERTGCS